MAGKLPVGLPGHKGKLVSSPQDCGLIIELKTLHHHYRKLVLASSFSLPCPVLFVIMSHLLVCTPTQMSTVTHRRTWSWIDSVSLMEGKQLQIFYPHWVLQVQYTNMMTTVNEREAFEFESVWHAFTFVFTFNLFCSWTKGLLPLFFHDFLTFKNKREN